MAFKTLLLITIVGFVSANPSDNDTTHAYFTDMPGEFCKSDLQCISGCCDKGKCTVTDEQCAIRRKEILQEISDEIQDENDLPTLASQIPQTLFSQMKQEEQIILTLAQELDNSNGE